VNRLAHGIGSTATNRNLCTLFQQHAGDGSANAPSGAGDEADFIREKLGGDWVIQCRGIHIRKDTQTGGSEEDEWGDEFLSQSKDAVDRLPVLPIRQTRKAGVQPIAIFPAISCARISPCCARHFSFV
jgi:hypothetical protein